MAKKQKKVSKGSPKWMATFSDLMTLVLVFFVMLFAMSTMDAVKFVKLKESFDDAAITEGMIDLGDEATINLTTKDLTLEEIGELKEKRQEQSKELDELFEEVQKFIKEKKMENELKATREEEGVKIVILDNLLFDSGEAILKDSAKELIGSFSDFFKTVNNNIQIEGHTDNRPINSYRYPSNWELSSARANSVIRYLVGDKGLEQERFISIGYGETKPVAPNDGPDNWQKNRRIVIFVKENF